MSRLPTPSRVAEAQAYARQRLEELKVKPLGSVGTSLHPKTGEIFARYVLKLKALSGAFGMLLVIEAARNGYDEAELALRELWKELASHKQCPAMLETYIKTLKAPYRRKKGRRKSTNLLQDMMFASLMVDFVQKFGLLPTRSTDAHCNSAADVLVLVVNEAKLLKRPFKYKNAERLWGQLAELVRSPGPDWLLTI